MRSTACWGTLAWLAGSLAAAAEPTSVIAEIRPAVLTRNFGPTTTPDAVKWSQAVADEAYKIEPVRWGRGHGGWQGHGYIGGPGPAFGYYSYRPSYIARPYAFGYDAYRPYYYSFGASYYAPRYAAPSYFVPRYYVPRFYVPRYSFYAGPAYQGCYHW